MLKLEYLKDLLMISIALSTITCAFIQKTKVYFKKSRYLLPYSFIVNMLLSIIFCYTFTDISFPTSLWIGLFSFIGADTIYKSLEGRLAKHSNLIESVRIPKKNIINEEEKK